MQTITILDTCAIYPGPNDRTQFDQQALQELAENISRHGLIQPITVRPMEDTGNYQSAG